MAYVFLASKRFPIHCQVVSGSAEIICSAKHPVPTKQTELHPLNMDITGHFESASCVIEVDGSATLAQVKEKLLAELGVPGVRYVGVRMKGGGDIGNDNLRICDTEMDEGCAVELYCTGANITPGVIPRSEAGYGLTLSPCDRYLAVMHRQNGVSIFDTETHERLCSFPCECDYAPSFSPCSEWISSVSKITRCAQVHNVKTGALEHTFGASRKTISKATAWSPCGTKLLSWCNGLQVWDIATGVVVHEWDHIVGGEFVMVVTGDRVAVCRNRSDQLTLWDYTTGVEVLVLTYPVVVNCVAMSPNERFIAACCVQGLFVWNVETGDCVFEELSEKGWCDVALSNDVVAAKTYNSTLWVWSISTGEQLLCRDFDKSGSHGLAISSCGGVVMYAADNVQIIDI